MCDTSIDATEQHLRVLRSHAVAVDAIEAANVGDVEFQPVHSWAYHYSIFCQFVFCMASHVFLPQKCQMKESISGVQ